MDGILSYLNYISLVVFPCKMTPLRENGIEFYAGIG
jgi:hypothetical protein